MTSPFDRRNTWEENRERALNTALANQTRLVIALGNLVAASQAEHPETVSGTLVLAEQEAVNVLESLRGQSWSPSF